MQEKLEKIHRAYREREREAESVEEKEEIRWKIDFLAYMSEEWDRKTRLHQPKVFVSYSGRKAPFLRVLNRLHKHGAFQYVHAMKSEGEPEVTQTILHKMRTCCLFLGILTKEYELNREDEEGNHFGPGKWAMLEIGMGLGFGLRPLLLVEEGIHRDYWYDQPTGMIRHVKFTDNNLDARIEDVIKRLDDLYRQLRREDLTLA